MFAATPLKVDVIASPILSVILAAVIILLILLSLGLGWRIQKMKKTYKFQRYISITVVDYIRGSMGCLHSFKGMGANSHDIIKITL
jgi:uncharacterized membrane protein YqjE